MNQQQYEAGQTIMQMSRIFAKAMRECMKNSGLLDDGFELHIKVWQPTEMEDVVLTETVSLEPKDYVSLEHYHANSFDNHCYEGKGWVVINDPIVKCGAVPPTVRTVETANRIFSGRKEVQKETPPDGLWISKYNDPYPVDLGE